MNAPFEPSAMRKALDEVPWPAFGIMDLLVVDNGLDLTSHGVQDACTALGIDLLFTPPRSPWYKGVIERAGGTFNTRFIHWLPGTTLGQPTGDRHYDGKDHAVLTFEDFELLVEQYIRTIHNKAPRREKPGTPVRRWLAGIAQWPVRLPMSEDELDAACALTRTATLRQTGLLFLGLQYQNTELGTLWNRVPAGTRITFKVNPLDLKTIKVYVPGTAEIISVDCVDELSWPRSLSYHVAVRQTARKMNLNAREARDLAIAEAAMKRSIAAAIEKSKATLRRAQADLYRQAEAAEAAEAATDLADAIPPSGAAMDLEDRLGKVFAEE